MRSRALACLIVIASATLPGASFAVDSVVLYRLVDKTGAAFLPPGAGESQWHFMPAAPGQYKIVGRSRSRLLGIANASREPGASLALGPDDGSPDHLWVIACSGDVFCKIKNVHSGLFLTSPAVQAQDSSAPGQLWRLVPGSAAYPDPDPAAGETGIHDPSLLRTHAGTYYLFGTHDGIRMRSSTDRQHFALAGQAFSTIPAWTADYTRGDLWAPDVSYHNGKYWLYYAASAFGKNRSAIGLATSATAAPGSWADQGVVYASTAASDDNAIDPSLIVDAGGDWWLTFGSFWNGLYLIQLDPATGKQAAWNRTRYHLARRPESPALEAPFLYRHSNYYYLFASFDQCCKGAASTYHIVVGRSSRVTGPYQDREGLDLRQGGGTILLGTHGRIVGPGGQSVLHDNAGDLLVYHFYDGRNRGAATLGLNLLGWDPNGWPHVKDSTGKGPAVP